MSVTIVSKLTVKTMKAQPARHSVEQDNLIATIYGRCTDKKAGTSDHGEYIRFIGEFEGINAATGEAYRSGNMIVPKTLEMLLDQAITLDENNAVDFAVEIWVEPTDCKCEKKECKGKIQTKKGHVVLLQKIERFGKWKIDGFQ